MADMSVSSRVLVLCSLLILCRAITPTQRFLKLRTRDLEAQQSEQPTIIEIPPVETKSVEEPSPRCAVEEQDKVQCGQAGITATDCISIQCCFNGTLCYYGKAGKYIHFSSVLCLKTMERVLCLLLPATVRLECIKMCK